jgi:hypothetical protein
MSKVEKIIFRKIIRAGYREKEVEKNSRKLWPCEGL